MGNKQSENNETEKSQYQEEEQLSQSQIQTQQPMFTIENSRNTQLTYPFYDDSPAKIHVVVDGITFWSNYDSGNLSKVEFVDQSTFNLSIAGDCQGRNPKLLNNKGARLWFNFKVKSDQDRNVNFSIINIATRFKTIWQYDSDIYVKVNKKWQRYPAVYQTFQVKFNIELQANQIVKFAYVPPWSYKKNQKYLNLYSSLINKQIYFRRETIAKSFEGRDIELLTMTQEAESEPSEYYCPEFLFPHKDQYEPPRKFKKPYILITARVHAGEVPSSIILKGILEQLRQFHDSARYLLENYVFLIIPMLNPDGVYRGHYRLDSLGYDQNRIYNRLHKYPKFNGPLAVLEIAKHHSIALYIDLHAHSTLTNSFIFTNWNPNPQINAAIQEFPRQMKQIVEHFRLKEAITTDIHYEKNQYEIEGQFTENEKSPEKIDQLLVHFTKENLVVNSPCYSNPFFVNPYLTGVGKSDVYLTTKTLFCYTLEINYRVFKKQNQIHKYEVIDYENLGKDILISLCKIHDNQNFKAIQTQYI